MTISYTAEVSSSCTGLGCFLKLLRRWKGSIYKLVWVDLILFMAIYYILNLSYAFLMDNVSKKYFRIIVEYCAKNGSLIPLSFVLGFYVNIVYTRWWSQYTSIPFPDNLAILVGASIKGRDERSRIFRRTIVRYVCVAFTMTLTLISPKAKKRFPSLKHFVESGLISEEEMKLMEDIDNEYPNYTKYWLPLAWASSVTTRARHEGIINQDLAMSGILNEINTFRSKLGSLLDYDWISVPLVYTQVVTIAVYSYFLVTVIGNQFLSKDNSFDVFFFSFPFMQILEFFFYIGWLKVAETLINPFGYDDDDFEVLWMIDRNVQVCYLLVDRIHQQYPKLEKDFYWDQIAPLYLPFTVATQNYIGEFPQSSTGKLEINNEDQDLIIPEHGSQIDGEQVKTGGPNKSLFLRPIKGKSRGISLRKVISISSDQRNEDQTHSKDTAVNEMNVPLNSHPNNKDRNRDFMDLYEERLRKRKEKLLKYVELISSKEDPERLVNDILK
ncbi:hypothetical protein JTB14_020997 [Gonioctena quinquepunctata]|nr:hypothetical protein JTB14_020997 [Gonioctena quinquepunctata]